jgi:hypothetical protein
VEKIYKEKVRANKNELFVGANPTNAAGTVS